MSFDMCETVLKKKFSFINTFLILAYQSSGAIDLTD